MPTIRSRRLLGTVFRTRIPKHSILAFAELLVSLLGSVWQIAKPGTVQSSQIELKQLYIMEQIEYIVYNVSPREKHGFFIGINRVIKFLSPNRSCSS